MLIVRVVPQLAIVFLPLCCALRNSTDKESSLAASAFPDAQSVFSLTRHAQDVAEDALGWNAIEDLYCCCRSGVQTVCEYLTTTKKSGCPKGQHPPNKELGEAKRCKIPPGLQAKLKPQKISNERKMCKAQTFMNEHVFPPEQFSDYAIRMALPDIPAAGDVFLAIKSLDIVGGSFFFNFSRIDDKTFHFNIHGDGEDEHEKGLAQFRVYLRGLEFHFSSGIDKIIKYSHTYEKFVTSMITAGFVRNHADLGSLPVTIETKLSGNVRLDADGQWRVIPESRSQYANVVLKNRGFLWWLYNTVIEKAGGMDTVLFDRVSEIVDKLVPAAFGESLQEIPFDEGQVSEQLQVRMRCSSQLRRTADDCEGKRLKVSIRSSTGMKMNPQPVINKLYDLGYFTDRKNLAEIFLESYKSGKHVFKDSHVDLIVDAEFKADKELGLSITPRMKMPMSLFKSIAGPSVSNFVPQQGAPLAVDGALTIHDGVLAMEGFEMKGVTLPVGTNHEEFITTDARPHMHFELEDPGGNPSFENHVVFGRTCIERCQAFLREALNDASGEQSCVAARSRLESAREKVMLLKLPGHQASVLKRDALNTKISCEEALKTLRATFDDALQTEWVADRHALDLDMPQLLASIGMSSGFTFNPMRTDYKMGDAVVVLDSSDHWRSGTVSEVKSDGTFSVTNTVGDGADLEDGHYAAWQMQPVEIDYAGAVFGKFFKRATELRLKEGRLLVGGQDVGFASQTKSAVDAVTIKAGDWVLRGHVDKRHRVIGKAWEGGDSRGRFRLSPEPVIGMEFAAQHSSDFLRLAGMSLLADPKNTRDQSASADDADGPVPEKFEQPFARPPRGLAIDKMLRTGMLEIGVRVMPIEHHRKEHIESTVTIEGEFEVDVGTHVYSTFIDNMNPDLGYMHYNVGGMLQYGSSQQPSIVYLSCGILRIFRLEKRQPTAEGQRPFDAENLLLELDLQDGIGRDVLWAGPVSYSDTKLRSEPKLGKDQVKCMLIGTVKQLWVFNHEHYFCAEKTSIEDLAEAVATQLKRFRDAKQRWRSSCTPKPDGTAPDCSHSPDGTWFTTRQPLAPQTKFPQRKMLGNIKTKSPVQEWSDALKAIFDPPVSRQ